MTEGSLPPTQTPSGSRASSGGQLVAILLGSNIRPEMHLPAAVRELQTISPLASGVFMRRTTASTASSTWQKARYWSAPGTAKGFSPLIARSSISGITWSVPMRGP